MRSDATRSCALIEDELVPTAILTIMPRLFSQVSCIDNLDEASEMALLRSYGPSVPDSTLKRLTGLFEDLRGMVDEGLLSYPYSTRELVNLVRHLEEFPKDSLVETVENVFAFDNYDTGLRCEHARQ